MSTTALFTIAKTEKNQPTCPLSDECILICEIYMQWNFHSATKNNKTMAFSEKWIQLENIMSTKIRHSERQVCFLWDEEPKFNIEKAGKEIFNNIYKTWKRKGDYLRGERKPSERGKRTRGSNVGMNLSKAQHTHLKMSQWNHTDLKG